MMLDSIRSSRAAYPSAFSRTVPSASAPVTCTT